MKIHESAENYLETILVLQKRNGNVRSVDIATELNFSKPSISNAMKQLSSNGYIKMDENRMIILTDEGKNIAEKIYERHQLISEFLVMLGVEQKTAVEDACRIEHVISEETFTKFKNHMNNMKK
ncbi:metal-dependent transcriptional regulator [Proteocatella sphenisci]|uniref:metal-dependent transcriptional regulator n=1 Tax=Proteocatella sphenisci TaxID=181070 RepID=UPI00048A4DB2|nr:metal-dependent transcriptional regulator [Proteocatella sphenisci]